MCRGIARSVTATRRDRVVSITISKRTLLHWLRAIRDAIRGGRPEEARERAEALIKLLD
jgi:hypothetical protein